MTDKKDEALKLALKLAMAALNELIPDVHDWYGAKVHRANAAIAAIREALADSALERMAENARELGLDYEPIVEKVEDSVGMGHKAWDMVDPKELAKGFHEALAEPPCKTGSQCTNKCQQCEQPAQQHEPVAYAVYHRMGGSKTLHWPEQHSEDGDHNEYRLVPLYTAPQQRQWVGLTKKEVYDLYESDYAVFYQRIEAKLKEKNNG